MTSCNCARFLLVSECSEWCSPSNLGIDGIPKHSHMFSNIYENHSVALRIGFACSPKRNFLPKSNFSRECCICSLQILGCFQVLPLDLGGDFFLALLISLLLLLLLFTWLVSLESFKAKANKATFSFHLTNVTCKSKAAVLWDSLNFQFWNLHPTILEGGCLDRCPYVICFGWTEL